MYISLVYWCSALVTGAYVKILHCTKKCTEVKKHKYNEHNVLSSQKIVIIALFGSYIR